MSRVLFIIFVLTFFLPDLFFRKKSKMTRTSGRLKVATLERRGNIQSEFFQYKSIRLHDLINDSLRQIVLKNASALFIYPAQFSKVTQKEYRESIQKIAREIPIVVIGAKIINSDHFCEYCKCIEPPVRRNEPLNARNRASYCEQESRPTIFIYRTNLLYNEVACLRA